MHKAWNTWVAAACWLVGIAVGGLGDTAAAAPITRWEVTPTSLVSQDRRPLQRINLTIESDRALDEVVLRVWSDADRLLAEKPLGLLHEGTNEMSVLLKEPC